MEEEVRNDRESIGRIRRVRTIVCSLVIVQALVVLFSLGGDLVFSLVPGLSLRHGIPFRILFFLGMSAGMFLTLLLVVLILAGMALSAVARDRLRPGWEARAVRRVCFSAGMIVASAAVVSGTSFLLIPRDRWPDILPAACLLLEETLARLL